MRVLVVHNEYRSVSPSGENNVVAREVAALSGAGVDVRLFARSSDSIAQAGGVGRLSVARAPFGKGEAVEALRTELLDFRPDVMHVHNLYPLISPVAIGLASSLRVPVVATVHNFRLHCMNGQFFRNGSICHQCDGTSSIAGAAHGCYRRSVSQSVVMSLAMHRNRDFWSLASKFIAVSPFVGRWLVDSGVPGDRVVVKPNACGDPGVLNPPGTDVLFVGRLAEEKGVRLLLDAWELADRRRSTTLRIAGDGPLRNEVETRARSLGSVRVLGQLGADELRQQREQCGPAVFASLWYEAHPVSVIESFAAGRPVVATSVGSVADQVGDDVGWLSQPEPVALAAALDAATEPAVAAKGMVARRHYEASFTPLVIDRQLMSIYEEVSAR